MSTLHDRIRAGGDAANVVSVPHGIWTTLPNDVEVFHCTGYSINVWWQPDGSVGTEGYHLVRGFAVRSLATRWRVEVDG